jgi:hypothetical protein
LITNFIEHLYTQHVTTSNYSAITYSHTLQFTTIHAVFLDCCVFTSRCSVTASNGGLSPYSALNSTVPQIPTSNSSSSQQLSYTSMNNSLMHQPATLHSTQIKWTCFTPLYSLCRPSSDHKENAALLLLRACMLRRLPSNSLCLQSPYLVAGLHATKWIADVPTVNVCIKRRYFVDHWINAEDRQCIKMKCKHSSIACWVPELEGNQLDSTSQILIKWSKTSDLSDPCSDSALTLGPLHLHLYAVLEDSTRARHWSQCIASSHCYRKRHGLSSRRICCLESMR